MSFRPTDEESALIERTRAEQGLATRADAVRFLLRAGAMARPIADAPVFRFRLPRGERARTSGDIDRALYGG